jgi:hypothetical protein
MTGITAMEYLGPGRNVMNAERNTSKVICDPNIP